MWDFNQALPVKLALGTWEQGLESIELDQDHLNNALSLGAVTTSHLYI